MLFELSKANTSSNTFKSHLLTYLLTPLRAWVHIRPQPDSAIGYTVGRCSFKVAPCLFIVSHFSSHRPSPSFFWATSLSTAIGGPSEGDSWQGCRHHTKDMTNPSPSPSLHLLCDGFCSCNSTQLIV